MPFIVFSVIFIIVLVIWVLLFIPSPSFAFSVGIFERSTRSFDEAKNKEVETAESAVDDKMKITLTTFVMCVYVGKFKKCTSHFSFTDEYELKYCQQDIYQKVI